MKFSKNKRIFMSVCATAVSTMLLTGFSGITSGSEAEARKNDTVETIVTEKADVNTEDKNTGWNASEIAERVQLAAVQDAEEAAAQAKKAYEAKLEAERKAAEEARRKAEEEARRIAEEKAAEEAARQEELARVREADRELLAALIFCEAGNQPYEGQVAVGAVVMNRVNSSVYPDSISEVIYQSGQFSPAMSGWLDSVRAVSGYTDSAMQAAEDALSGSNPVGDCLYFSTGGYGMQIGDHFFH